jgi:hypothetical protein
MRRTIWRCAALVLFSLVAEAGFPAAGLHITTSLDGMSSSLSAYLVPTVAITIQPEPSGLGVGGELALPVGPRGDRYMAVMAILKIGMLDIGAGFSTRLVGTADPSLFYPKTPQMFAGRLGITWPIWTIGPGRLGLNASVDWLFTEYLPTKYPAPKTFGDILTYIFILPALGGAEAIKACAKVSAGMNYTIDL